jgi:hypothetical protein
LIFFTKVKKEMGVCVQEIDRKGGRERGGRDEYLLDHKKEIERRGSAYLSDTVCPL